LIEHAPDLGDQRRALLSLTVDTSTLAIREDVTKWEAAE